MAQEASPVDNIVINARFSAFVPKKFGLEGPIACLHISDRYRGKSRPNDQ